MRKRPIALSSGRSVPLTILLLLMGVLICQPVLSARAAVLLDEQFNTDVFLDSSWSRSHSSVAVDIPNGWLRIGSNGAAGDFADKHGPFPLPLVIEWRERTFSGSGSTFSLPILQLWWGPTGDGSYHVTYVQEILPFPSGWLLGIWTNVHTLGTTSWDQWRTVKAIIRSDGGELFAKLDGDLDFTPISSATWTVPSEITRIRLSQHSDDVSDFDYVKVSDFTSPDTLRIGNSTCLQSLLPAKQAIPIYLDNRDTVKAGDIPLCYDWSYDPDSISFVGTRLASMDFKTRTIDATNNNIRIGFVADFGGSGNVLAPIDDVTRETPVAKVFFHRPYVCAEAWVQPPDTCSVVLEADVISLELIDKFDQPYMPIVLRDSTKALPYRPGDCDMNGSISVSDAVCMISYIFSGGSAPCLGSFDANCDGLQSISDPVYVINYIFGGGPVPGSNCLCGAPPFAKTTIGHADISTATTSGEDINEIAVNLDANSDVRAIQLNFNITGDVRNIQIKSDVSELQLFSSEVDGGYRIGLIDLTGTAAIPSGKAQIATITYEGEGELSVSSAIVVDNDANEMNVEIANSKLESILPKEYSLSQNQPNPFNPATDISFSLPKSGPVKLVVYNILGAEVATLVNEVRPAGVHRVTWNGTNNSGQQVASGIYLYRLTAGDFAATKKMLLLK